ncbi:MAG: tetratricopeptide repeat protein, partial [Moorea sp. SIO3C2]|nr:tetratricopeptide repeat protein [Moorena sp. SIO3C2]
QQQLAIASKNDDNLAQAEALTNLCCIYYFIKDYEQARKYQNQSYKIAIQLEHKELEAKALLYKGMISHQQGENKEAINCYEQSLELIYDMGLILEKAEVLANLAISERELEKDNIKKLQEKILDQFNQALSIFNKRGNSVKIANVIKEIAKTYDFTGDFDMAKKYCKEALEMTIKFNLALEKECRELQAKLNTQNQYYLKDKYSFTLPEIQEIDEQKCEVIKTKIDVVIMTVTDVEKASVLDLLKPYPRRKKVLKVFSESETYYLGKFGAFKTVVSKCRMGSMGQNSAILATEQALRKWNPRAIVMVGIAFGKDGKKQNIGDVLVASEIISYEPQRVGENEEIIYRGSHPPSNTTLLNRFENVHDWKFNGIDDIPCKIRHGAILSGEKLVDEPEFKAKLFKQFPQAIGGEMEGTGLSSACMRVGTPWILVKSICDWADGKKDSKYQPLAARAAASLVHHVLKQRTVLNGIDKRSY